MRLDLACVELGIFESRNKAQEAIKNGNIFVNDNICKKVSNEVDLENDSIVANQDKFFVSRAAMKLDLFLETFDISINNSIALDIGASTGGFSQVLLQRGARIVHCVDVGTNQLHNNIKNDNRVTCYENTDIRDFNSNIDYYSIVVCDISFISIRQILYKIEELLDGICILLFKPQFEVGREAKRSKKGIVLDKNLIDNTIDELVIELKRRKFEIMCVEESKIKGKEGNAEFFIASRRCKNS